MLETFVRDTLRKFSLEAAVVKKNYWPQQSVEEKKASHERLDVNIFGKLEMSPVDKKWKMGNLVIAISLACSKCVNIEKFLR